MKGIYSLLIILFISNILSAQTNSWIWADGVGGANFEKGQAICTDNISGDIISTGTFSSSTIQFNGIVLTNQFAPNNDCFLVKYDYSGQVVWALSFGSNGFESGLDVHCDNSGNIYVAGQFSSPTLIFDNDTLMNNGVFDWFLVKFDANGNYIWSRSGGGAAIESGVSLTSDITGNIYMAGNFTSNDFSFGSTTLTNYAGNSSDFFILKFSSSGSPLWAREAGGTSNDYVSDITIDNSGFIYITGSFRSLLIIVSNLVLSNTTIITSDIFVLKYSLTGQILDVNGYGGDLDDAGTDIDFNINTGKIVVCGVFNSDTLNVQPYQLANKGYLTNDPFVMQLNGTGGVEWAVSGGSSGNDAAEGVKYLASGSIYISGTFTDTLTIGNQSQISTGLNDVFLAELDSAGNFVQVLSAGGAGDDFSNDLAVHGGINLLITGSYAVNTATIGNFSLNNNGSSDIYIAEYGLTVGTDKHLGEPSVMVYPNPSSGEAYINSTSIVKQISIYTSTGELLKTEIVNDYDVKLAMPIEGLYFLNIQTELRSVVRKVIIIK